VLSIKAADSYDGDVTDVVKVKTTSPSGRSTATSSFDKSEVKIDTLAHGMWTIEATALARGALRGAHRARRRRALAGGGARRGDVRSLRAAHAQEVAREEFRTIDHDALEAEAAARRTQRQAAARRTQRRTQRQAAAAAAAAAEHGAAEAVALTHVDSTLRNKKIWLHKTPSHTPDIHLCVILKISRPHDRNRNIPN
jgi:hypothetical protein